MRSVKKLLPATLATALRCRRRRGLVLARRSRASARRSSPANARSQQDPQQGPVIRSQVNLVNLFVTVRDNNKRIVTDLKQARFQDSGRRPGSTDRLLLQRSDAPDHARVASRYLGQRTIHARRDSGHGRAFLDRVLRKGDEALDHVVRYRRRSARPISPTIAACSIARFARRASTRRWAAA